MLILSKKHPGGVIPIIYSSSAIKSNKRPLDSRGLFIYYFIYLYTSMSLDQQPHRQLNLFQFGIT